MSLEPLQQAVRTGRLRPVDLQLARRLADLGGGRTPEFLLAAALVSHRVGEGDVCLDLADCAGLPLFRDPGPGRVPPPPGPAAWRALLKESPLVGTPGERAPLILDGRNRLYLGRYWQLEQRLAEALAARAGGWAPGVDRGRLAAGLARLFPPADPGIDWQKAAAAVAVLRPFCVVSGGPGTGKTRTVTSILALLAEQSPGRVSRIALAAPTGKAAARLTESIRGEKAKLPLDPALAAAIPDEAMTLHRLLGFRPGRVNPRHGPDDPLHLDTLVVDEASMVDLPLMSRLVAALPGQARLILLGDKDQLASVEAGMVLGDICGRGRAAGCSAGLAAAVAEVAGIELPQAAAPAIADHILVLRRSYRFGADSGIGALARAVNAGDGPRALELLEDPQYPDVERVPAHAGRLQALLAERVLPVYRALSGAPDPEPALAALSQVRVLCAVREGPHGVRAINHLLARALGPDPAVAGGVGVYPGRPLMITANDYAQGLFNGDLGVVLPDPGQGGALRVFFQTPQGIRRLLPSRLPPHETAYAMTVHKSQGSELREVLLVLPDVDSRVLTRELLYTGITRARERVTLVGTDRRVLEAAGRPVQRSSGLLDALWLVGEG
jgi:exodeoxyribonuclease V alpha subunit